LMFSHALAVALLAVAIWAIQRQTEERMGNAERGGRKAEDSRHWSLVTGHWSLLRGRWDWLAGFACGWVLASEFTAGLIVVGIGVWVLGLGWDRALRLALGAVPPLFLETDGAENHEPLRRWILGSLDPRFRQVLLLRMDGLRVREIAGALGLPPGTVKRHLQLARKKLRSAKEIVNHFGFSNVV
jgi:DNA-binding CsgD family transcriptional regulator